MQKVVNYLFFDQRIVMRTFIAALTLTASFSASGQIKLQPPSFPASILEAQFPAFKGDSKPLSDLRRHRQQLEFFREQSLEGYNRALKKHLAEVRRFDGEVEKARASGRMTAEEYETLHRAIEIEFEKSGPSGDYLDIYSTYLEKYKNERDWVLPEISALERERVKF